MESIIKEFREFVVKGNLIELAVAFIMGGLFARLVEALVNNVIMPIIAIPFGEPNFDQALILTINDAQIRFGAFLTVLVAVLFTALGVFFFIVKPYNSLRRRREPPLEEPARPTQEQLLTEIRDLLAARR